MNSDHELRVHGGLASVVALIVATSCSSSPMSNLADADVPGSDAAVDSSTDTGGAALAWTPGHYILLSSKVVAGETAERDSLLNGLVVPPYPPPVITPFVGMLIKYYWADFEGAQGDYSAGFAHLDADLSALAAHGKKLLVFFQYKTFDGAPAVPAYMLGAGPWCVGASGAPPCGEGAMSNGLIAMFWQSAVAARLHAWFGAVAQHIAASPHRDAFAGFLLPETACGGCDALPLYTQAGYELALEQNLGALASDDPQHVAFQYTNFIPPNASGTPYVAKLGNYAKATRGVGLGCPDLVPADPTPPPGYTLLKDPSIQTRVPFNVAVEAADYSGPATTSLASTYDLGVNQLKAGQISWLDMKNPTGNVFTIGDVAAYIAAHPFPNTAPPTW